MKKLLTVILLSLSFNIFATNMNPTHHSNDLKLANTIASYHTKQASTNNSAHDDCNLSEKELHFFNDELLYPEKSVKTFLGFDLDIIEMGLSFVSLGFSIIPTK